LAGGINNVDFLLPWSNNSNPMITAARQVALALQLNPNFAEAHLLAGNISCAQEEFRSPI
jgi:hypothetical protein